MATDGSSETAPRTHVAIACWIDLLGYGCMMDEAQFDPADPAARLPLKRLRKFHEIVAEQSGRAFPTLAMNDGAVAYANVRMTRKGDIWHFVRRACALHAAAHKADLAIGGLGLRSVVAVGLRARGSARGIRAQEDGFAAILRDYADEKLSLEDAIVKAGAVRRYFDIVPQLQANYAFTRAYEAEQSGRKAGFEWHQIYLDCAVLAEGVPSWMSAGAPVQWTPKKASLATDFVPVFEISAVSDDVAEPAFRTGKELIPLLRKQR